ncbi:MAG: hypothetical protein Pg6C_17480 [Treponemataceae bacterium]|nr:MAG: hypothetical protein Pg6C_17480 [Treponemataceae bacterium]
MKLKRLPIIIFLCLGTFLYTQTRDDITVYLAPCTGGTVKERAFFDSNFKMEIGAAGYTLKDEEKGADYMFKTKIENNLIVYSDGTSAAVTDNPFLLTITLVRNADKVEIVQFSYPFSKIDDMNQFNLYLVHQALANVPLTKLTSVPDTNYWRNKWVYLRASFDYPITFYALQGANAIVNRTAAPGQPNTITYDNKVAAYPGASAGIEFQFLNWMSVEGIAQLNFGDPIGMTFIPVLGMEFKFPLKPSRHFMIEPYAAARFPMATTTANQIVEFPALGAGGGVQFGVKGGEMGAFFIDMNFIYYIGEVMMKHGYSSDWTPATLIFHRYVVSFGIGYKIGFFNRI